MKSNNIYKVIVNESNKYIAQGINDNDKSIIIDKNFNNFVKEKLVYKKNDNCFLDLNNDITKYSENDIVSEYTIPLNSIINLPNHIPKKKVLEIYRKYLEQTVYISNLYIGDIGIIIDFDKKKENKESINQISIDLIVKSIKKNHLFLEKDNCLIDLETNEKYYSNNISLGFLVIINKYPFINLLENKERFYEITNEKVLTMYRKHFKENYIS